MEWTDHAVRCAVIKLLNESNQKNLAKICPLPQVGKKHSLISASGALECQSLEFICAIIILCSILLFLFSLIRSSWNLDILF